MNLARKTFYEILELDPKVGIEEVRNGYRRLAAIYHPDRWVGRSEAELKKAERKIRQLNEAYSVLSREHRRKLYDDCLAKGIDFYEAEEFSRPETAAEREVREAVQNHYAEAVEKCTRYTLETFQKVFDLVRWKEDPPQDPYFGAYLSGQAASHRFRVWFKTLTDLQSEDFPGIANYARAMLHSAPSGLIRENHVYVLVGKNLGPVGELVAALEPLNQELWAQSKGRAPRAYIGFAGVDTGFFQTPGVAKADLDLKMVRLTARPIFEF